MRYLRMGPLRLGLKVDWDICLRCGKPLGPDEERYRVEAGHKVGVGHRECQ